MKRTRDDTRLEIWSAEYINCPKDRQPQDKNAKIIQIEPGHKDYIVEVLDVCPKE